jgi:hypothetical protein
MAIALPAMPSRMFAAFDIPLSRTELLKRTAKETSEDDCLGPGRATRVLLLSRPVSDGAVRPRGRELFPLTNFIDEVLRALRPSRQPKCWRSWRNSSEVSNADKWCAGLLAIVAAVVLVLIPLVLPAWAGCTTRRHCRRGRRLCARTGRLTALRSRNWHPVRRLTGSRRRAMAQAPNKVAPRSCLTRRHRNHSHYERDSIANRTYPR